MRAERLEAADFVDKACSQLGYDLSKLIALVSIWIDPKVVEMLASVGGVWYPQHRRANLGLRFEGNPVEKVGQVIDGITLANNTYVLQDSMTCFMFFGQLILLFWTAGGELSDVEEQFGEAW
jgi:hypothetical protein